MQEGRPAGRYPVLLYLVRGRLPEALKAYTGLRNSRPVAETGDPVFCPSVNTPCNNSACAALQIVRKTKFSFRTPLGLNFIRVLQVELHAHDWESVPHVSAFALAFLQTGCCIQVAACRISTDIRLTVNASMLHILWHTATDCNSCCTEEDRPLMSLAALLESASALVPEQARAAATQPPGSTTAPEQKMAHLFCSSLLPRGGHGTQPASLQSEWSKVLTMQSSGLVQSFMTSLGRVSLMRLCIGDPRSERQASGVLAA